jgi:excisionase family DNA binding protein
MKGEKPVPNATSDMPERLNATLDEAAEYLRVSRRQVQVYQERGLLKPVRFGKLRRFRWKEIKELEKNGSE